MRSRNLLIHGSDPPPAAPLALRAGLLSLLFEPDTVWVRNVSVSGVEVVRAIYAAVRDRSWGTVTPRIEGLETETAPDSFRLRFGASCRNGEIDFYWRGEIKGSASSEIVFDFDGEARSTFLRNRVGLCVLHPLVTCVGRPCEVEHVDGAVEAGAFPATIAPHQPFQEIRAIRHVALADAEIEVRLEGDTFEMEDQRNWTDASFKTYCTPLALPLPVKVEAGARIRQRATVRLRGLGASHLQASRRGSEESPIEVVVPEAPGRRLPGIGLGLASHGRALSETESTLLRSLGLSHLRSEVTPTAPGWEENLRRSVADGRKLGTPLEVALHLPEAPEAALDALGNAWRGLDASVSRWIISTIGAPAATPQCLARAQEHLGSLAPGVAVVAGSGKYFAELNRIRPEAPCVVSFPLNPQVHAFDNRSLVENLEGQAHAVRTACSFSGRPVVVSPVTLRRRPRPDEAGLRVPLDPDTLPPQVDLRQMSLFGAAWTLGSLAELTVLEELHSLTYFETTGWLGVMESEAGPLLPTRFPSAPGEVFPMFHVFADLAGFSAVAALGLDDPRLTGLCLFDGSGARRLLLANLTGEVQSVLVKTRQPSLVVRLLDEANLERAMADPLSYRAEARQPFAAEGSAVRIGMLPYAVAALE